MIVAWFYSWLCFLAAQATIDANDWFLSISQLTAYCSGEPGKVVFALNIWPR